MRLLFVLVTLFTLDQLKAEKCDTACLKGGYDVGAYNPETNQCLCGDKYDYQEYVLQKKLVINHTYVAPIRHDSYVPYTNLWD